MLEWRTPIFNLALAFGALILVACTAAPQPPGYDTLRTCETASSVISRLAVQRQAGLLSPSDIERVDSFVAVIDPICSSPTPPTLTNRTALEAALDQLELILAREATE